MTTHHALLGSVSLLTAEASSGVSPFRAGIRIVLGIFIALLLAYIVVEQVGYWLRRRSGRDE